jgi:hypothetical protein
MDYPHFQDSFEAVMFWIACGVAVLACVAALFDD